MYMLSVHFIPAVSIIPLILHYLESQIDIAEMPYLSTVGFKPATGQMPTPDHIVTGIERKIDLDSVAFGGYAYQGRALPVGLCPAVIFGNHQGAMGHLRIPVGDYDSIEGLGNADLGTSHGNHEISHHRIEQAQFSLGAGCKIVKRPDLYELTLKEKCSFSYIDRRLMKRTHNPWKF
jgi:hypothetical protein